MPLSIATELAGLRKLTVKELQARYAAAFGETTPAHNKTWLVKRIAWRLQALAEGDLSERARQRARFLANDADLRILAPKVPLVRTANDELSEIATPDTTPPPGDTRRPWTLPGSVITRIYKGQTLHVKILAQGFEFGGTVYRSLSAVAKAITGQHCSGIAFFRLAKETAR